jgi:hypothetical protein
MATTLLAQVPDVSKPPPILKSAGKFSVARLSRPPLIDGREWVSANVLTTSSPGTLPLLSRDGKRLFFSRRDCAIDCRDVRAEYYELSLP